MTTKDLGAFGLFSVRNTAAERQSWRHRLFGPVEMIATAADRHSAAMAACLYLAKIDDPLEAIILRDRDGRKNLALIQWNHMHPDYRFSSETWAD